VKKADRNSPEWWEQRLAKEGLSMEAGTSRRLTFVGGTQSLEKMSDSQQAGTLEHGGKEVTHKA
jgi:hypothetical protein